MAQPTSDPTPSSHDFDLYGYDHQSGSYRCDYCDFLYEDCVCECSVCKEELIHDCHCCQICEHLENECSCNDYKTTI
jgi:hypothetical protein